MTVAVPFPEGGASRHAARVAPNSTFERTARQRRWHVPSALPIALECPVLVRRNGRGAPIARVQEA
jgi:hypothetical protein